MKLGNNAVWRVAVVAVAIAQCNLTLPVLARPIAGWTVEVNEIQTGNSHMAPEFKAAIYENLLSELSRTKQFSAVLRSGDRRANDLHNLLILKTAVESYTAGSERRRAVTTITGATKLKVRSQLCTPEGQVIFERVVDGNVRFFGENLRATHNVAHRVANAIRNATLPHPELSNMSAAE